MPPLRGHADNAERYLTGRSGVALDIGARGPTHFASCTNYLIDLDHAVIVGVEAIR